jgi:methylated-DNA-[protein]-cysteine S-methyltransferase
MPSTLEKLPIKKQLCTEFAFIHTDWGIVGIIARGRSLLRLVLPVRNEDQAHCAIEEFDASATHRGHLLEDLQKDVADYFQGIPVQFDVPLDVSFTNAFRRKILMTCAQIEYGQTLSYGQLASQSGHPGAARAVGNVMAQNPIPIIIPCHRVITADGRLGGYSAGEGVSFKEKLLKMENTRPH